MDYFCQLLFRLQVDSGSRHDRNDKGSVSFPKHALDLIGDLIGNPGIELG